VVYATIGARKRGDYVTMAQEEKNSIQNNVVLILVISVLLLGIGQYTLYRNIQHVKDMISVSTMELKEGRGVKKDAVFMDDGKMMIRKNGSDALMGDEVVMGDGTHVLKDGTVVKTDGSRMKMKEGDEILMDGKTSFSNN
jgi:hypothetical protein